MTPPRRLLLMWTLCSIGLAMINIQPSYVHHGNRQTTYSSRNCKAWIYGQHFGQSHRCRDGQQLVSVSKCRRESVANASVGSRYLVSCSRIIANRIPLAVHGFMANSYVAHGAGLTLVQ